MIDAYHMANGKRIDEAGSGYVETGLSSADTKYTKALDWNMYLNREPRFYVSILYNHDTWVFTGASVRQYSCMQLVLLEKMVRMTILKQVIY
jgi:hypothetical protein